MSFTNTFENDLDSQFKLHFPAYSKQEFKAGIREDLGTNLYNLNQRLNGRLFLKDIYKEGLFYCTSLCLEWKRAASVLPTDKQIELMSRIIGEILEELFAEFDSEWSQKIVQFVPLKLRMPDVEQEIQQYYSM
ncbi:hypothetical protein [uncultured Draconibacterium sp.]|uniref:hypothetical protein n=1 Tax=uncultured Draconibacterium sp. TaxID=1573823 RepID=UPI0032602DB8